MSPLYILIFHLTFAKCFFWQQLQTLTHRKMNCIFECTGIWFWPREMKSLDLRVQVLQVCLFPSLKNKTISLPFLHFFIYIYQQCFLTKYSKQVLIKPDTLFSALRFSFRSQQMKQKYNSCSRTIMR